jgi:hypothetical protein
MRFSIAVLTLMTALISLPARANFYKVLPYDCVVVGHKATDANYVYCPKSKKSYLFAEDAVNQLVGDDSTPANVDFVATNVDEYVVRTRFGMVIDYKNYLLITAKQALNSK